MRSTEKAILIIYDISDNKRRKAIVKLLKSFGNRVQESAFECIVTPAGLDKIIRKSRRILNSEEDNLRIYTMNSYTNVITFGNDSVFLNELFGFS